MYLESFRHLIEIQGLSLTNDEDIKKINSEHLRISDLESKREKALNKINDNFETIKNLKLELRESQISDQQDKIQKLNNQLMSVKTLKEQTALEDQINDIKSKIELEELKYFEDLELSESLNEEIKISKQFLEGSLKSLEEISSEVNSAVSKLQDQINNRTIRINSLLDQCRPDVVKSYKAAILKFKTTPAMSFLLNKKCSLCNMQVDSMLKINLEQGATFEHCPHCDRILLPETARIY